MTEPLRGGGQRAVVAQSSVGNLSENFGKVSEQNLLPVEPGIFLYSRRP